ncbi:enediyne antibiotic chromoprotein [Thermomonospora amylolytica]|uniref:enediyne antibiotic chromoprotein n=1 Tax=Thermomonospora amylolytica TaxID=1411117 RepID=UPI001300B468|nr:enediyne antibiotic chromoprotein [Thermomonospora amylolytica]
MSLVRTLSKVGVTTALAAGLTVAFQPAASASPVVTVTPSTNLEDGTTVQVAATGLTPNKVFHAAQCAMPVTGTYVCGESSPSFTTDASGSVQFTFVVRRSFDGDVVGGGHYGTVDCKATVCAIAIGTDHDTDGAGSPPLSFR